MKGRDSDDSSRTSDAPRRPDESRLVQRDFVSRKRADPICTVTTDPRDRAYSVGSLALGSRMRSQVATGTSYASARTPFQMLVAGLIALLTERCHDTC